MIEKIFFSKRLFCLFCTVCYLPIVYAMVLLACGARTSNSTIPQKEQPPNSALVHDKQAIDSLPKGRFKKYGEYVLEQGELWVFTEQENTKIEEVAPNILSFTTDLPYSTYKLEYYDAQTGRLKKQIDLSKLSPYTSDLYRGITIGHINYHDDEVWGLDSNCVKPKFPKPDTYRTSNWVQNEPDDGFVCVSFILVKLHSETRYVVDWEQTLMVFNPDGQG